MPSAYPEAGRGNADQAGSDVVVRPGRDPPPGARTTVCPPGPRVGAPVGRTVLLGDAAYAVSLPAGQGASPALAGLPLADRLVVGALAGEPTAMIA
ncbi:hypothetical protein [Actinoplanes sp. NPDC049316]|uniref:hypothetical protein n=1 Tax=Actinoplanes sp. NPDC049316 TaxID=3154727 RepID=UPI003445ED25